MDDKLFSVRDQVVVVSGGSRGIGHAIAAGFAERGAQLVVTGREARPLEQAASAIDPDSRAVRPLVCDVRQSGDIQRLVDTVIRDYGHVDTLINVAGVNRRKPALDISEADYDFIMDINLKGAFLLSQQFGRHMVQRGSGSQINVASINTDRPLKNVLPYAMSKAAMAQLTRGLAVEWGGSGVRVNALAPGFVLTDLTRKLWSDDQLMTWGRTNTPQRRLAQPADMVGTAIFLASAASAYLTGQVLYVDGGFTAGWNWPIPESPPAQTSG